MSSVHYCRDCTFTRTMIIMGSVFLSSTTWVQSEPLKQFRAPAIPLINHDPYFSAWSFYDRLNDGWPSHWTEKPYGAACLIQVDGHPYRLMGPAPDSVPAMKQSSVSVWPTRTIYCFESDAVEVVMTFMSPMLPFDLKVLSRPVNYITWDARSRDGKEHSVTVYFDLSGEWCTNVPQQEIEWSRYRIENATLLRMGTTEQPVLKKAGDDIRIDWGYVYLIIPDDGVNQTAFAPHHAAREGFAKQNSLPASDDLRMPRPAGDGWPVMACRLDFPQVGNNFVTKHLAVAYDDLYAIEYFNRPLRAYWHKEYASFTDMLNAAVAEYETLKQQCREFDQELYRDLEQVGGENYALLASLAFRQCLAAHKLVIDFDGTPLYFSKECFSNGCIATVDVTYPASPFFLLFNPELLKAQMRPILEYANSYRWKFPFAPHDLGTYPKANGQVYGGGEVGEENQMPVEECGNMLLMLAALARIENHADFAREYRPLAARWADYLLQKGMDPENQLCTDDFAGHLAHNCNLSLKAILALGGYAQLCERIGEKSPAKRIRREAERMVKEWLEKADDGDHYRLAFDQPGTWSQKYNLVWDNLLDLNLFPDSVERKEIAYYKSQVNQYGLPLDSRTKYTKTDWSIWTASLTESSDDFRAIVDPIFLFLHDTPDRVPITDWYWTHDAKQCAMQARPVIGGVFIPLLQHDQLWEKWANWSVRKTQ